MILLGSSALAVGIFASSLTTNQIISAVVSGGILVGLWFLGTMAQSAPTALKNVLNYISLSGHFSTFAIGVIDTRDVIYYLSVTVLFLYLSIRSIEQGRWS
jgi:ABC-2 type transport system permease protein